MDMDMSAVLFASAMLHAGYLIQLCFRQPSQKQVARRTESRIMWFVAGPNNAVIGRVATVCLCIHHAMISLSLTPTMLNGQDQLLHSVCPATTRLDPQLFTWSKKTIGSLMLLYTASYVRLQAYAQLGTNFTYRLAVPDGLVTNGLYAYVRHPSYTGLYGAIIALKVLFLNQHGAPSCIGISFGDNWIGETIPTMVFFGIIWWVMMRRVNEEEKMMEKEFGQKWRNYREKTTKFIPFLI